MKIIDLYNALCEDKTHLHNGLCDHIHNKVSIEKGHEFNELFRPTDEERNQFLGRKRSTAYWGSDETDDDEMITDFSDTRQNMLLLFAAINGEL